MSCVQQWTGVRMSYAQGTLHVACTMDVTLLQYGKIIHEFSRKKTQADLLVVSVNIFV